MIPTNANQLIRDSWQKCLALLPPQIACNLTTAKGDPAPLKKGGGTTDIIRIRILPADYQPPRFWSSKYCFYQLAIGTLQGSPLILGGVHFLQFTNQKRCGSLHYTRAVTDILTAAQKKRPNDFKLENTSTGGAQMPCLARYYHANPAQKFFPSDLAAQDLAWLITETLPKFQSLPPAP